MKTSFARRPPGLPNRHQPKIPHSVALSRSEGSVCRASRCFAAAQHDNMVTPAASSVCHPEPQRRVYLAERRDASLRLSMTTRCPFISFTARNRATLPSPAGETMKVTPTDHPASCLSTWLRLMRIGSPLHIPARFSQGRSSQLPGSWIIHRTCTISVQCLSIAKP